MASSSRTTLARLAPFAGLCLLALAVLAACNYVPGATPPAASAPPASGMPPPASVQSPSASPTVTPGNIVMCTPPPCVLPETYYCPGNCPGGCGTICATPTGQAPTATTGPVVMCTPPACGPDESYYCPGSCPGGCGTTCATRTPDPAGGPSIEYFRAVPAEADPGGTVTLEWQSRGAARGALYHLFGGQLSTFWDVAPNGSMTYTVPSNLRNSDSLMLFMIDDAGRNTSAVLVIALSCPDTWFFSPPPGECASGPAVSGPAAEQTFERGRLLWLQGEGRIYALFDDGNQPAWAAYTDEWRDGDPESDPALVPPSGLYQPVRGFGLVWREQPGLRDRLGWATGEEAGFTGTVQRTGRIKYNLSYLRALDGGVWELGPEGSAWRHIP